MAERVGIEPTVWPTSRTGQPALTEVPIAPAKLKVDSFMEPRKQN